MTEPRLHLIKLSAGCDGLETLRAWQAERLRRHGRLYHRTRMMPRRREALLAGGSIYWVIRGLVTARQRLIDIVPVVESDGGSATHLILDPELVRTEPRSQRIFQGWRYLLPADTPPDLGEDAAVGGFADMPAELLAELRSLGLI